MIIENREAGGPSGTVVSSDGTTIAYDRYGSGEPVVLVVGALSGRTSFAPLAQALAPHFTVFAYDRRGRGASGDTQPYAVERELEDLAAIAAEAGDSPCALGHSSGAGLVIRAAAAGVPFSRLALYEPPFMLAGDRTAVGAAFIARQSELIAAGRRGEALENWMVNTLGASEQELEQMRQAPYWAKWEAMAQTTIYDATIMQGDENGTPMPREWAETVKQPALAMVGEKSAPWMQNSIRALAGLLPDARLRTFPGAGHGFAPEAMVPVLREFCADR